MVIITLTEQGKALQEQAQDIPNKVSSCIDLPADKAKQLYTLLYELLETQGYEVSEQTEGAQK